MERKTVNEVNEGTVELPLEVKRYFPKTVVYCSLAVSAFIAFRDFLFIWEKFFLMIILFVGVCIYLYRDNWKILTRETQRFIQKLLYRSNIILFIIAAILSLFRPDIIDRRFIYSEQTLYYVLSEPGWPGEDGTVYIKYFRLTKSGIISIIPDCRRAQLIVNKNNEISWGRD